MAITGRCAFDGQCNSRSEERQAFRGDRGGFHGLHPQSQGNAEGAQSPARRKRPNGSILVVALSEATRPGSRYDHTAKAKKVIPTQCLAQDPTTRGAR